MENWKRLTDAAREVGISSAKLSNMVKQGRVSSKKDARDERVTLVDVNELKRVLGIQEESHVDTEN